MFRLYLALGVATGLIRDIPSLFAGSASTIAVADAFVATGPTGNLSTNNYGGGGALGVAAPGLTNGEFQTVMRFDLSGIRSSFDTQYGPGQWFVQTAILQLTSSPHANAIFNDPVAGLFNVSLMQNNSWVEGTGTAGAPGSTGVTYNSLQNTFISTVADQALGTFGFPGGTSGANNYNLGLSPGMTSDILSGSLATLRLYAADQTVSYLFSSRSVQPPNQPQLLITVAAVPEPGCLAVLAFAFLILMRYKKAGTKVFMAADVKRLHLIRPGNQSLLTPAATATQSWS